jgi:hypothetical protein
MTDSTPDTANFPFGSTQRHDAPDAARITSTAITLLNYIDALQEYLQDTHHEPQAASSHDGSADPFAARLSAVQALRSITRLLQGVGYGRPVDGNEFRNVLNDSHTRFVKAGLLPLESALPFSVPAVYAQRPDTGNRPWFLPEWCIMKLYEGVTTLVRDESAPSHTCSQTQPGT